MNPQPAKTSGRAERGDLTRDKLLTAAIDIFGRFGFDGATTRALADAASVNQQAIAYYFGGKEGLYIATAEHIAGLIAGHAGPVRERAQQHLAVADAAGHPLDAERARTLLTEIVETMAVLFIDPQSAAWARFLIREQMAPTAAFASVYKSLMKPMLDLATRLVAIVLGQEQQAASEPVRLRTLALLGGVMVFRMANASALAQLGWSAVGPAQIDAIKSLAHTLVAALALEGRNR